MHTNVTGINTVKEYPYPVITKAIGVSLPNPFIIIPMIKGITIPAPKIIPAAITIPIGSHLNANFSLSGLSMF